jgi:hypothetical protein
MIRAPLQFLQQDLPSERGDGEVLSSDDDALAGSLGQIDGVLDDEAGLETAEPPSPTDMQSRVSALIDAQVRVGSITSSQGSELKAIFAKALLGTTTSEKGAAISAVATAAAATIAADGGAAATPGAMSGDALIGHFLRSLQRATNQGGAYTARGLSRSATSGLVVNTVG